jgi:hypothetical protein
MIKGTLSGMERIMTGILFIGPPLWRCLRSFMELLCSPSDSALPCLSFCAHVSWQHWGRKALVMAEDRVVKMLTNIPKFS